MIAKNGQYILSKWKNKDLQEANGILVPNSSKENQQFYVVQGFGLDNRSAGYVSIGDVVVCDRSPNLENVLIGIDNLEFHLRTEDRIYAVVDHDESEILPPEFHVIDTEAIPEEFKDIKAAGDKVVILRDTVFGVRKHGNLFMGYSHREVARSHTGTLIAIGDRAAKATGVKIGMRVIYDYSSSHGHDYEYDMIDSLNLLAVLSKYDQQRMGLER